MSVAAITTLPSCALCENEASYAQVIGDAAVLTCDEHELLVDAVPIDLDEWLSGDVSLRDEYVAGYNALAELDESDGRHALAVTYGRTVELIDDALEHGSSEPPAWALPEHATAINGLLLAALGDDDEAFERDVDAYEQRHPEPTSSPSEPPTRQLLTGGAILDLPDTIPAVWGAGQRVAWAEGERLMICAPAGRGQDDAGAASRARALRDR